MLKVTVTKPIEKKCFRIGYQLGLEDSVLMHVHFEVHELETSESNLKERLPANLISVNKKSESYTNTTTACQYCWPQEYQEKIPRTKNLPRPFIRFARHCMTPMLTQKESNWRGIWAAFSPQYCKRNILSSAEFEWGVGGELFCRPSNFPLQSCDQRQLWLRCSIDSGIGVIFRPQDGAWEPWVYSFRICDQGG